MFSAFHSQGCERLVNGSAPPLDPPMLVRIPFAITFVGALDGSIEIVKDQDRVRLIDVPPGATGSAGALRQHAVVSAIPGVPTGG